MSCAQCPKVGEYLAFDLLLGAHKSARDREWYDGADPTARRFRAARRSAHRIWTLTEWGPIGEEGIPSSLFYKKWVSER